MIREEGSRRRRGRDVDSPKTPRPRRGYSEDGSTSLRARPKRRHHQRVDYGKYESARVAAEKQFDPEFEEEKPKRFPKRAATKLLRAFAESKTLREEGNRRVALGDYSRAMDTYAGRRRNRSKHGSADVRGVGPRASLSRPFEARFG